jgi:hypothetical protein
MSKVSFKKFNEFVETGDELSDEQINEIFGLFRNNAKLDKLKKERERLKGMSSEKKKELDAALAAWAAGDKKKVTPAAKAAGANDDADWDDVLDSRDRKVLAKQDKVNDLKAKNQTGRRAYEALEEAFHEGPSFSIEVQNLDRTAAQALLAAIQKKFAGSLGNNVHNKVKKGSAGMGSSVHAVLLPTKGALQDSAIRSFIRTTLGADAAKDAIIDISRG